MNQTLTLGDVLASVEDAGLFSSVCTFQEALGSPDAIGQQDLVDWTDVDGLADLPCMMAPLGRYVPNIGDERKMPTETLETTEFHLLLDGYFPQVLQRYRVLVDGSPYDVMGTESDSQKIMTRLAVRRALV